MTSRVFEPFSDLERQCIHELAGTIFRTVVDGNDLRSNPFGAKERFEVRLNRILLVACRNNNSYIGAIVLR